MAVAVQTEKNLDYYLGLPWTVVIIPDLSTGAFVAKIEELPGCLSEGDTLQEVAEMIEDAKRSWLEVALKKGMEIPEPGQDFSGKILVRVPKGIHRELSRKAKAEGVSLNLFIASALSRAVGQG